MPHIMLNPTIPGACHIIRVPHLPDSDHSHAEKTTDEISSAQRRISEARSYAKLSGHESEIDWELCWADVDLIEASAQAEKAAQAIIDLQNYAAFWRRLAVKIANESGKPIQLIYFPYASFNEEEKIP